MARLKSSDMLLFCRVCPKEYYRLQEMALVKPDKVVALLYVSPSLNSDNLTCCWTAHTIVVRVEEQEELGP